MFNKEFFALKASILLISSLAVFLLAACSKKNNFSWQELPQEQLSSYLAARTLYENSDFSTAYSAFSQLVEENEESLLLVLQLAKTEYMLANFTEAELHLAAIYKKLPSYLEASLWYARLLIQMAKFAEAETVLTNILQFNSTDSQIYSLLAQVYAAAENPKQDLAQSLLYIANAIQGSKKLLSQELQDQARLLFITQNLEEARESLELSSLLAIDEGVLALNQQILSRINNPSAAPSE